MGLPEDFALPLHVQVTDAVHLRPIHPDDTDIGIPAVMGNQPMLWEKYGAAWGWPPADEGALFGCIYIDPAAVPNPAGPAAATHRTFSARRT